MRMAPSTASKSGIQYTCDACSADISHTVRIRCAHLNPSASSSPGGKNRDGGGPTLVCDNFDLCGRCFCEGREVGRHKKWHDYRVVVRHSLAPLQLLVAHARVRNNMRFPSSPRTGAPTSASTSLERRATSRC